MRGNPTRGKSGPGDRARAAGRSAAAALALLLAAGSAAPAAILTPEWSRPLPAAAIQVTVGRDARGEELLLLLADGSIAAVGRYDTLRIVGTVPASPAAIAAIPRGDSSPDSAALVVAAGGWLIARTDRGRELWRQGVGRRKWDSLAFVDRQPGGYRLLAWEDGVPLVVRAGPTSAQVDDLRPGFVPSGSVLVRRGPAAAPELAVTDGTHLCVTEFDASRQLSMTWPGPGAVRAPEGSGAPTTIGTVGVRPDSAEAVVLLTDPVPGSRPRFGRVRMINAATGESEWSVAAGPPALPGPVAAIGTVGTRTYLAGADPDSGAYVALLDAAGVVDTVRRLACPAGTAVYALDMLGSWPVVFLRTVHGLETFLVLPPGLSGDAQDRPAYQGVRLDRFVTASLTGDTFPDVVVCRTSADTPLRLDVFSNAMRRLASELAEAEAALHQAALGRSEAAALRALRRVELVRAAINPGQAMSRDERQALHTYRSRSLARILVPALLAILVLAAAAALLVLARQRRRQAGPQIEDKPLPVRIGLAVDLVALDHNFVTKGNMPAALERLREVRHLRGLEHDRDLAWANAGLEPYYTNAIGRLVDGTPTISILELLESSAGRAAGGRGVEVIEMGRERLRHRDHAPGVRLILVRNFEYPESYRRMRLLTDATMRSAIEHIVVDHVGYARTWAEMVLDYTVSTQWNRKLTIHFLSDSAHRVDLGDQRGHLVSQLGELASSLQPVVEVPDGRSAFDEPDEKLWLRITDLVAVLEETRARLRREGDAVNG